MMVGRLVIIGVGLIGGSLGMAVRRAGLAREVVGVGRETSRLARAVERGAVDVSTKDLSVAVEGADLVVLATPVGALAGFAKGVSELAKPGTILMDVGSVKGPLVAHLEEVTIPRGLRFVGAHPLAGGEQSGVEAASADLFIGTKCIMTPTARTDPEAHERVRTLWERVGAQVVELDPLLHDEILAAVSHLPHMVAYALVAALVGMDSQRGRFLEFSAGGFRDFTRIAASSPEMWRDICLMNRDHILALLTAYERELAQLKELIARGDAAGLFRVFDGTRAALTSVRPS